MGEDGLLTIPSDLFRCSLEGSSPTELSCFSCCCRRSNTSNVISSDVDESSSSFCSFGSSCLLASTTGSADKWSFFTAFLIADLDVFFFGFFSFLPTFGLQEIFGVVILFSDLGVVLTGFNTNVCFVNFCFEVNASIHFGLYFFFTHFTLGVACSLLSPLPSFFRTDASVLTFVASDETSLDLPSVSASFPFLTSSIFGFFFTSFFFSLFFIALSSSLALPLFSGAPVAIGVTKLLGSTLSAPPLSWPSNNCDSLALMVA